VGVPLPIEIVSLAVPPPTANSSCRRQRVAFEGEALDADRTVRKAAAAAVVLHVDDHLIRGIGEERVRDREGVIRVQGQRLRAGAGRRS